MGRIAVFPEANKFTVNKCYGFGVFCLIKKKNMFNSDTSMMVKITGVNRGRLLLQSDLSISFARKSNMLYYQTPFSAVACSLECCCSG